MDEHLGDEMHDAAGYDGGNRRNGKGTRRVITDDGELQVDVPRDREGTFEPKILPKGQPRLKGFDDKIIALCARGMRTRDVQAHIEEMYDVDVSPSLISRVTDQVKEEVDRWQTRQLDAAYPIA